MKVLLKLDKGSHVLLLEDSDHRIVWFRKRIPDLVVVSTVQDAIITLAMTSKPFDAMFLDHDLGMLDEFGKPGPCGDGAQFCRHLAETGFIAKTVVIHSWSPIGAKKMKAALPDAFIIPWGKFEIEMV